MKLSEIRQKATSGIVVDRKCKQKGKFRVTTVDVTVPITSSEVIHGSRIDFTICDDVLDQKDLSRDERRDLLTWYGEVAKKLSKYRKKR